MKNEVVYAVLCRIEGENEDALKTVCTSVESGVSWIEKFGRGWTKENYFFVISSFILDHEKNEGIQPIDTLLFFDQEGKILELQPF